MNAFVISARLEGDASSLTGAAGAGREAVEDLGASARRTQTEIDAYNAAVDRAADTSRRMAEEARRAAAATPAAAPSVSPDQLLGIQRGRATAQAGADIDAYGRSLDRLRAKYVPVFAAQQTYEANLRDIDQALRVGAISTDEHAAATQRASLAYDMQMVSLGAGGRQAAQSTQLAAHEMTNLTYQMNDMAMMLASGQAPFMTLLQQGPQVAQIMGPRGLGAVISGLVQGIWALVTPTTLFLGGIAAAGYAASAVFSAFSEDVRELDEVLSDHEDGINRIKDRWGEAAESMKAYGLEGRNIEALRMAGNANELRQRLSLESTNLLRGVTYEARNSIDGSISRENAPEFREFYEAIALLRRTAAEGQPDILRFRRLVTERWNVDPTNEALTRTANALLSLSEDAARLALALPNAEKGLDDLGGAALRAAERAERFTEAQKALRDIITEPLSNREQATQRYRTMLDSADDTRSRRIAMQTYQEELRQIENVEAGRGKPVPTRRPNDLEREAWAPSGRDTLQSQREALEFTRLEMTLIGSATAERERAIAALEAEHEIRRLKIDAQGDEAQAIRANARAIAEANVELERHVDAWRAVQSAGESAVDGIVDKLIGGDVGGALEALASDVGKLATDLAIKNPIKNALLGTNLGTMDEAGGMIARLFGIGDGAAIDVPGATTVGSMQVQAASVVINGAGAGLLSSFTGTSEQSAALRLAANDNGGNPFLDLIGRAEGTDRGRGYNETLGYGKFTGGSRNLVGMTLDEIDALQTQMLAHPDNHFNSSALGRYQIVRKTRRGLQEQMGLNGSELFNEDLQDRMALQLMERRGNSVGGLRNEWEGLRRVDASEITSTFNQSLQQVGSSAKTFQAGFEGQLNGLVSGMEGVVDQTVPGFGKVMDNLLGGMQGAGKGTGGGGILSSLLGGSSQWAIAAGGGVGLYDKGGFTGSGDPMKIAGFVHQEEYVFDAAATRAIGVGNLEAIRRGALKGYRDGGYVSDGRVFPANDRHPAPANSSRDNGPNIVINNYSNASVRAEEQEDGRGGRQTAFIIEDEMAKGLSRPGSAAKRALNANFGLRRRTTRR